MFELCKQLWNFFKIMSCIDFFSSKMKVISFFSELNVKSSTDICDQCPGVIAVVGVELRHRLGIAQAVARPQGMGRKLLVNFLRRQGVIVSCLIEHDSI